jgi:hypothetical protein
VCTRESECGDTLSRRSTIETDEQLVREPLGTSWLKDGADVAVIPQVTMRKRYTGNRRTPRKDEGLLGCSGRTTLRRRQCKGLPV